MDIKTEFKEFKVNNGQRFGIRTVLDFWRWGYSDLTQNITRGVLAEFLVAWGIGKDKEARDPWQSYDLKSSKGKKIEVKSTADAQAWTYGNHPPKFTVKPTRSYDRHKGYERDKKFQADIYVLAHLMGEDLDNVNPLDTTQWEFWVLTQEELISLLAEGQSISVSRLRKVKSPVGFEELVKINEI